MDPCSGVDPAPLTVPSQRTSAPCLPSTFDGACIRCRCSTEPENPWNVCGPCLMKGSGRDATVAVGSSTIRPRAPARCAVPRRVSFRVPSHAPTTHGSCPPYQTPHGPHSRRDRAAPRTDFCSVVPSVVTPTHATLAPAPKYPQLPPAPPVSRLFQIEDIHASGEAYTDVNREGVPGVCGRLGCGTQLPARVPGSMCEACTGAGFARPPSAVIPKRIPRRITERPNPNLRESLDVIRATLLREIDRGSQTALESTNIKNELEVDLVYPDDIPANVIQHVPTASEPNKRESKSIEDEGIELDLMYPEAEVGFAPLTEDGHPNTDPHFPQDAAMVARTSMPISQIKPPPSTTLRELFKDGLQAIPALQDLEALVNTGPPQRCRVPGCNEVLHAQSHIQRCMKCSIGDWKRRRLAAVDTLGREPNTSLLTTETPMEEEEVVTNHKISGMGDGGDLPSPPFASGKISGDGLSGDRDGGLIPCSRGDLSCSDSDAESIHLGTGVDPGLVWPCEDTTGLRIRVPMLATRLSPNGLFRKCGNKKCNIATPKDSQWKTCDPCRRAQRIGSEDKQRYKMAVQGPDTPGPFYSRRRSLTPDMYEVDTTLTPETSRPCSVRYCQIRIPLPEVYRWKMCRKCRARARRKARQKRDLLLMTQRVPCQTEIVPRFPAYQSRGSLLSSFDVQLKGFAEGQIVYFRTKLQGREGDERRAAWRPEHTPMVFGFVGEYSVVTGQKLDSESNGEHSRGLDKSMEMEEMRREVSNIVSNLGRVLRAKFSAGEAFAIGKRGILMRFTCSLELIAQLQPLANTADVEPGPSSSLASGCEVNKGEGDMCCEDGPLMMKPFRSPPAVPLVKSFSGELEVVIVPDESHYLFHGRRMVVRYNMIG